MKSTEQTRPAQRKATRNRPARNGSVKAIGSLVDSEPLPKVRVQIDLTPAMAEKLVAVKEKLGLNTTAEAVRAAIALADLLYEVRSELGHLNLKSSIEAVESVSELPHVAGKQVVSK